MRVIIVDRNFFDFLRETIINRWKILRWKWLVWARTVGTAFRESARRPDTRTARFIRTPVGKRIMRLVLEKLVAVLLGHRDAPLNGDAIHSIQSFFEQIASADQRKAQEVFPFRTKGSPGNCGDARFFQKNSLDLLS